MGIQVKDILRRSYKTEYNRQFKHVKEEDRDPFIVPDWVDEINDNHIYAMGFAFSHAGLRKMRRAITSGLIQDPALQLLLWIHSV